MFFVYRSHYNGPLSKHVQRLPDDCVLAWFRRGRHADEPDEWAAAEPRAQVYGLTSIFETDVAALPESTAQLREVLHGHLYVEGPADVIRLDEHSLRVRTDDDEVQLAYFFLDDAAVAAFPDRLAYLLHEQWPLPHDAGPPRPFEPDVPVTIVAPAGPDAVTTYAVFLTFYDGESLARTAPVAFPGVALPALAAHLRDLAPGDWPPELLVLRALTAPGEDGLGPALERCNRWPGFNLNADPWPGLPDRRGAAHEEATAALTAVAYMDDRSPDRSLLRIDDHLAQLAMHCGASFGFQQWYLFDTLWAATHPDLARSFLRYAQHWDPLGPDRPTSRQGG